MAADAEEVIDMGPGGDVDMEDDPSVKRRGRGFDPRTDGPSTDGVKHNGKFDLLGNQGEVAMDDVAATEVDQAAKSVQGYIIIVTGIDEEATEEEVLEKFSDYGKVNDCHLNLDRRTGYVKGYALLDFQTRSEAEAAIDACQDGLTLMEKELKADFAFVQPPAGALRSAPARERQRGGQTRHRSRSPTRR